MTTAAIVAILWCLVTVTTSSGTLDESVQNIDGDTEDGYTNVWAVEIAGGEDVARRLALKHGFEHIAKIYDDYYMFEHKDVPDFDRYSSEEKHGTLSSDPEVKWLKQQKVVKRSLFGQTPGGTLGVHDDRWRDQEWYLNNTVLGMNIVEAWERCRTGQGVNVAVVDDGIDYTNYDLARNFDLFNSYDMQVDRKTPMPGIASDSHGTSAAGIIGAEANDFCGVGIAFDANVAGIRIFGNKRITDALEARALTYNMETVDVYSCSWGMARTGFDLKAIGELSKGAMKKGATEGRGGKGSIYVFASGNGGTNDDSCAYDGFANSIYTIPVGGLTHRGRKLPTGEKCSAMMATAYSKSSMEPNRWYDKIFTTGYGQWTCADDFGESSAAAPMVAAVIALALEANPSLTSRDVMHLITRSARSDFARYDPDSGWFVNGAGFHVSSTFGFGLLDAAKMVDFAERWQNVPEQTKCSKQMTGINGKLPGTTTVDFKSCDIKFVEHVEVFVFVYFAGRGYVKMELESPVGTRSLMIPGRKNDLWSRYLELNVSSVQFWGEQGTGDWKVHIGSIYPDQNHTGTLFDLTVNIYGTKDGFPVKLSTTNNNTCNQGVVSGFVPTPYPPSRARPTDVHRPTPAPSTTMAPTVTSTRQPESTTKKTLSSCRCSFLDTIQSYKFRLVSGSVGLEVSCPTDLTTTQYSTCTFISSPLKGWPPGNQACNCSSVDLNTDTGTWLVTYPDVEFRLQVLCPVGRSNGGCFAKEAPIGSLPTPSAAAPTSTASTITTTTGMPGCKCALSADNPDRFQIYSEGLSYDVTCVKHWGPSSYLVCPSLTSFIPVWKAENESTCVCRRDMFAGSWELVFTNLAEIVDVVCQRGNCFVRMTHGPTTAPPITTTVKTTTTPSPPTTTSSKATSSSVCKCFLSNTASLGSNKFKIMVNQKSLAVTCPRALSPPFTLCTYVISTLVGFPQNPTNCACNVTNKLPTATTWTIHFPHFPTKDVFAMTCPLGSGASGGCFARPIFRLTTTPLPTTKPTTVTTPTESTPTPISTSKTTVSSTTPTVKPESNCQCYSVDSGDWGQFKISFSGLTYLISCTEPGVKHVLARFCTFLSINPESLPQNGCKCSYKAAYQGTSRLDIKFQSGASLGLYCPVDRKQGGCAVQLEGVVPSIGTTKPAGSKLKTTFAQPKTSTTPTQLPSSSTSTTTTTTSTTTTSLPPKDCACRLLTYSANGEKYEFLLATFSQDLYYQVQCSRGLWASISCSYQKKFPYELNLTYMQQNEFCSCMSTGNWYTSSSWDVSFPYYSFHIKMVCNTVYDNGRCWLRTTF
ncbi:uncharacterized protein LOC106159636 [Lingula anatina]|uniref:Uncharacterized protein LOC106159636 n=1 Tax=Lingula anatina TaxID=7574 RepID=A0A1S3HZH1_LINAN|nr:uncharacterized protein LOC106159636 [Lingula anatina]|eukprot:XP_013391412.1 uncharacterized protein LOC106159636 [Lingula anatina]